jgi:UrcA family protein
MFLTKSRITEPVALALAMSLAAPAAAQAVVQSEVVVRYVSTRGLDLANPADVKHLRRRVEVAVTKICGVSSQADLLGGTLIDNCRRIAARSAEPQIAARIQRDTEYAAARTARPAG